jgi:SP family sugar:H+ symporter-like MFS transporter
MIAMYLNNYLGRRLSLAVTGVVSIIGVLIEITSSIGGKGRFGQFVAGKTIASIAMGLAVNIVPVYLSETSTARITTMVSMERVRTSSVSKQRMLTFA